MENTYYSNIIQITYFATASVFFFYYFFKSKNRNDFGPLSFLEAEWCYISPFNIIFKKEKENIQPIHTSPIIRLKWRRFSILWTFCREKKKELLAGSNGLNCKDQIIKLGPCDFFYNLVVFENLESWNDFYPELLC